MIYMTPDDSERILEDFLINASKNNTSKELADESLVFLNDTPNKKILLAYLLIRHKDYLKHSDNGRFKMRNDLIAMLTVIKREVKMLCPRLNDEVSIDTNKNWFNPRLQFAVDQFVEAFYSFDNIEQKYPNLNKRINEINR